MKFNSSNDFSAICRLVFRIELAPPGTDAHLSEGEIARSLGENYPFYKMKVKGDIAIFSGLDGNGEPASFDCSGAQAYRHNFGALVDQGGPVMVQFGLRSAGDSDPPHLRVTIDEYVRNDRYLLVWLLRDLAAYCGEAGPFDESRITLEEIEAVFILGQRTIEEVQLSHQLASAGALETMVDAEGSICGYQIGQQLDVSGRTEMPRTAFKRQVEDSGLWEQTREFGLRSLERLYKDGRSGVALEVQLRGAIGLKILDEKNLLAGLEIKFKETGETRRCVGVHDWNVWESWARIVLEASALGARD
jgi:hypothetical protein